jgi:diacylglycerol kinase family enzyme
MKVTYDTGELEGDFIYGMVTNSISVGGMKRLTGKNVVLDDGLFEVTLVRQPKNPMDIQMIMSSLIGFDVKTDAVYSF